jgi:hypothetical protein
MAAILLRFMKNDSSQKSNDSAQNQNTCLQTHVKEWHQRYTGQTFKYLFLHDSRVIQPEKRVKIATCQTEL